MAPRKKQPPAKQAAPPPPSIETLLATKAANDPQVWKAMLNLNKMRSAQRQQASAAPVPPATKDRA